MTATCSTFYDTEGECSNESQPYGLEEADVDNDHRLTIDNGSSSESILAEKDDHHNDPNKKLLPSHHHLWPSLLPTRHFPPKLLPPLLQLMILSILLPTTISQDDQPFLAEERGPSTTYISDVLNRLVDKSRYDKRLRPTYGSKPVLVGVTLHVSSISSVSEVNMDFTVDFYLRQFWQDPRLAYGKIDLGFDKIKTLTVGVEYLDRLWKPDTFFPNEKKSFFHTSTSHNSFLRIDPDGGILLSQRLTVTATCPMNLKHFPMDTQECKLEIESYGYTTNDIELHWGKKKEDKPESAVAFDPFRLPQFHRTGYRVNTTTAVTSSGSYVRLYVQIILTRSIGFYLMTIIIPSVLIVSISWVSFWLNRESSPARVNLGVLTILTMTTLITVTNNSMPKVSYIKGLDVFLMFCFTMVFAALIEYAIVSYFNKQTNRKKQAPTNNNVINTSSKKKHPVEYKVSEVAALKNAPSNVAVLSEANYAYRPPILPPAAVGDCDCDALHLSQYAHNNNLLHQTLPFPMRRKEFKCQINCTPSKIDRCSRLMFPCTFIIFNFVYWIVMKIVTENAIGSDFQVFTNNIEV